MLVWRSDSAYLVPWRWWWRRERVDLTDENPAIGTGNHGKVVKRLYLSKEQFGGGDD